MINTTLQDFVSENFLRNSKEKERKNVITALNEIVRLSPTEIGHLIFIIACAERAHSSNAPLTHFKQMKCMLKSIAHTIQCDICF